MGSRESTLHDPVSGPAGTPDTVAKHRLEADTDKLDITAPTVDVDQSLVESLALRWQEMRESGEDVSLEAVCREYPHLLPLVRSYLMKVAQVESVLNDVSSDLTPVIAPAYDFLRPPEIPDEIGRLGGYSVKKMIGKGGMGMVFLAEDLKLKRQIALKVLRSGASKRFLREAQTLALIEHDHIVTVYQIDQERGVSFLAMPFLKGETLERRLRHGPRLEIPEVLRLGREIALGLAAAHQQGVIHRDIKPSNIWLELRPEGGSVKPDSKGSSPGGAAALTPQLLPGFTLPAPKPRVKILDFGLARISGEENLTSEGTVVGTPAYMAPEQARGLPIDERVDLFSLGCILYEMCTGKSPFSRKDVMSILRALEMETPPHPNDVSKEVPRPLADLIMRLLEKNPQQRVSTAQEVVDLLLAIEQSPSAKLQGVVISRPGETTTTYVPPRSRNWAMTAGLVAALAVAAAAVALWRPWEREIPPVVAEPPPQGKLPVQPTQGTITPAHEPELILDPWVGAPGARQDFALSIDIRGGDGAAQDVRRFAVGEKISLKILPEKDSYIGVWLVDAEGVCTQLFPNLHDPDHFVKGGQTRLVPPNEVEAPAKPYSLKMTPSKGVEALRIVASTVPWKQAAGQVVGHFRLFKNVEDLARLKQEFRGVEVAAADGETVQFSERVVKFRVAVP